MKTFKQGNNNQICVSESELQQQCEKWIRRDEDQKQEGQRGE